MNNLKTKGYDGERKAREFLRSIGVTNMQQIDWLTKFKGKWYAIEVKNKNIYKAPPFDGTGLNLVQLRLRAQLLADLGIDTLLINFEPGTRNVYIGRLSRLEKGEHFDTKNNIRIYNISNFKHYEF